MKEAPTGAWLTIPAMPATVATSPIAAWFQCCCVSK